MRMMSISSKHGVTEICAYGKNGYPLDWWFYLKNGRTWQEFDIRELFRQVGGDWPVWADPMHRSALCRRIDLVCKWLDDNRSNLIL